VTRVASSHLRIGTFQFFAARGDLKALKKLCDYTIERHYPGLPEEGPHRYISLVEKVVERTIRLVVEWMRVGFIHGVMNTDNTSLSGETIDYGPCAMMGIYDPETVYSSIDKMGRYAFGRQPEIAAWNMARFAESLLPLIDDDSDRAIDLVGPVVEAFPHRFRQAYMEMMAGKLGLTSLQEGDEELISSLLDRLKERRLDYTVTFDLLTKSQTSETAASKISSELGECLHLWQKKLKGQEASPREVQALMRRHNPLVIPRNHHVEELIQECEQSGNAEPAENFLQVLRSPYEELPQTSQYQDPPRDGDKGYKTFCGT